MPIVEFALAAAERGFDAVLLPEHTHIPVASAEAFPLGDLPDRYRRTIDPFIGLAFVAAHTSLEIGTCISLVAQHDPIALAKAIATLDFLSHGRMTLGVGYGWNRHELADHGHRFVDRRAVAREHVELMRALWRDTEAEFRGDHVRLPPSWAWPKPVQTPIPVLLGCSPTARGFEDVARWADGWIPVIHDADLLADWLQALDVEWRKAERPESGPIIWAMQHGEVLDDEALRSSIDRFHVLGVNRIVLDVQTAGRDELLPILDRYADVLSRSFGRTPGPDSARSGHRL